MIKQVMVGSKRYDIREDKVVLLDGEQVGAKFEGDTSTIVVASTLGTGAKPQALVHEIIHSILFDGGYATENDNEKLVNDLAQQFILLVRQNPHLIRYIQQTAEVDQSISEIDPNFEQDQISMVGDEDD